MIFEVAHQMGLIPLVAMMVWGRKLPARYWFVAVAFTVSWLGDSAQHFIGGAWWSAYAWLPLQFGFLYLAFLDNYVAVALAAWGLLAGMVASILLSAPGPDVILSVGGSLVAMAVAKDRLAFPVWIYFGLGTVAYLFMVTRIGTDGFMPAWYGYQACRFAASVVFSVTVYLARSHAVRD